jgi:uncharacterized membrane protein YqaE (UPF0057 family)
MCIGRARRRETTVARISLAVRKRCENTFRRGAVMDLLRILLAILLPPLGVFLQVGLGGHFWLNILLTLLGYIPGIIHAVWIIATR